MEYEISEKDQKMIDRDFAYHPPGGDQTDRYVEIRRVGKKVCEMIYRLCPESRERSLAKTHIEIAIMMANAAIARNEDVAEEV